MNTVEKELRVRNLRLLGLLAGLFLLPLAAGVLGVLRHRLAPDQNGEPR